MIGADFIDSNVFIYLLDSSAPAKTRIARDLINAALDRDDACTSFQVIQETLNVITRKLKPVLTREQAQQFLESSLLPFWRIQPSAELYARALDLQQRYRFSFYDSLIVSAALEGGCTRLLTEDLQHGQLIEGLRIENPFLGQ